MAEVKWIKIVTDVFDDEKTLMIETLPEADSLIVIWFKLLCLAGKQNNSGVFLMGRMPYTDEMFATVFRRPINTVRRALRTFEDFGMIEIINDTVTIPNWDKHQSLDAYEKKKERDRLYQAERRATQKRIAEKSSDTSSDIASKIRRDKKRQDKNRTDVDVEESPATATATEEDKLKLIGGELGKNVVYLTDRQFDDLLNRLGMDAFNRYVDRLASFIIEKNAHVKNHYETILKWWEQDSKVSKKSIGKARYGSFDTEEAFNIALERTYGSEKNNESQIT
jgi:predicted phage replisome organizer